MLLIEASQKAVLDQMMDRALSGLHQLEEAFNQAIVKQQPDSVTYILEELLRINQQCRMLDKTLKTSYFRDRKLMLAIQGVKGMLNKEREGRMVKKARDLFHANTGRVIPSAGDSAEVLIPKLSPVKDGKNDEKSNHEDSSGESSAVSEQSPESSPSTVDSDSSDEEPNRPLSEDMEILALLQEFLDMDIETKELLASIQKKPSQDSSETDDKTETDDTISWWVKYLDETSFPPGLLVSRMVCRCLESLLGKVLTDLTDKWEELKKCGKLKVLGDDEEDDDDDDDDGNNDGDSVDQVKNLSKDDAVLSEGSSVDPIEYLSEVLMSTNSSDRARLQLQLTPTCQGKGADIFQSPITPQTPADIRAKLDFNKEGEY